MADDANARYLVLSDVHFGTSDSSINDTRYHAALIGYVASKAPWKEIVFTGDLLDVNLSTLTRAIEGGTGEGLQAPLFGFRQFLQALDTRMKQSAPNKSLKDLTGKWIYVPGNHDYKIWDVLSTRVALDDVLAGGHQIGWVPTPLMKYKWTGDESFFAGIFRPYGVAGQVIVEYPNHEILFGQEQERMVLTHGHYLDASQTRGSDLSDHLRDATTPGEIAKTVREIFIETAQYQTVANAVSFTQSTRNLMNDLVGPDGWSNKFTKLSKRIGQWLLKFFYPGEARKGEDLSPKQLLNIEYYLERFCGYEQPPRWFIFGHTHRQGKGRTSRVGVEAYNAGSCYIDRGIPVTFAEIEAGAGGKPTICLMCVDQNANVGKSPESE